MENSNNQIYEKYWSITLAYTDINSDKFKNTLKTIIKFIDTNNTKHYTPELYQKLQEEVNIKNLEWIMKDLDIQRWIKRFNITEEDLK